jgi:hypothetical protein
LIVLLMALACTLGGAPPAATAPTADALEFRVKPAKTQFELGEPVTLLLTLKNVSDKPLSVSLWAATHCWCDFEATGVSGQAGDAEPTREVSFPGWQRLEPGGTLSVETRHNNLTISALGQVKVTATFDGGEDIHEPPPEAFVARRQAETFTITVVENALMRRIRAQAPDRAAIRSGLAELFERKARDTRGYSVRQTCETMSGILGAVALPDLVGLAEDMTFSPEARAGAACALGDAIRPITDQSQQQAYRDRAAPVLLRLVRDPSPLVRKWAVDGLTRLDRQKPPVEAFAALVADPDEDVRRSVACCLWGYGENREAWPFIKQMIQDRSPEVRQTILQTQALRCPRNPESVQLILDCLQVADEEAALALIQTLNGSLSGADVVRLWKLLDRKPPRIRVEIVKLAARTNALFLHWF